MRYLVPVKAKSALRSGAVQIEGMFRTDFLTRTIPGG
jgi:hypothetical protein